MQNNNVKIGLIGCGRVTQQFHLPALSKLSAVEVIALCDVDSATLNRASDEFQVAKRFADYCDLLSDSSIDIIGVCVPVQYHTEIALAALDADKHVFIEKPLALTLEECHRLVEKAKDGKKKVTVGFNLRHHRLISEAKRLIQNGVLGSIEGIRSTWTSAIRFRQETPNWRDKRESGGGALFEIAVHHFDLWRFLLRTEIEVIHCISRSGKTSDETVTLNARMANGVLASALFSECTADQNELVIYGKKGHLRISLFRFDGLEFFPLSVPAGSMSEKLLKLKQILTAIPGGLPIMRQGGDFKMTYVNEWRHFIDAIQKDGLVSTSLQDGRRALEAVLAATESASSASTSSN